MTDKSHRESQERPPIDVYVAAPYSHQDTSVRLHRFNQAAAYTAILSRRMILVYCPICHGHPLAAHNLPTNWEYWANLNRAILQICRNLHVLCLDGWKDSTGVAAEIAIMMGLDRGVHYIENPQQ